MKIDSPRLGCLEVESNKLIEFPAGLPGFEDCKTFTLVEVGTNAQVVAVLQSADRPEVAFSVTTPDLLGLHYEFTLSDEETSLLKIERAEDVAVMVILREDASEHRRGSDLPFKANLTSPLVINAQSRLGMQKVIARLGCDVTLRPAD